MPFLRRRGNAASETDMRRRTLFSQNTSATADDVPPLPVPPEHLTNTDNNSPADSQPESRADRLSLQDSRASTASRASRPSSPPVQEQTSRHRRFSVLRFRNASDSQLSLRAKQQAEKPPPMPRPPEIITTAPTNDFAGPVKKTSRVGLAAKLRLSSDISRNDDGAQRPPARRPFRKSFHDERGPPSLTSLDESSSSVGPPNSIVLQPPLPRESESSRSDESSVYQQSPQSPNATPKKVPAASPFFRLRRAKKTTEPMFPLAHLQQKNRTPPDASSSTSLNVAATPRPASAHSAGTPRVTVPRNDNGQRSHPSPAAALFAPGGAHHSGHSSPTRTNLLRGRSSTMSSVGRDSTDDHLLPPTTRTSSSTGRKSFGDLFGLSRLRQNSELTRQGSFTPATPGSLGSKNNSLQIAREPVPLPERREEESPAKYLSRVEEVISRGIIAAALSKGSDSFAAAVLRSYMRSFSFFGDPMDMALRKLLMEAELPKETQHIDRCLQAFANRYHECNPGIYSSPDQAYFIAFSLLILHTDVFNKNNKHKMQKSDYLKNAGGEGIFDDILECFYDNISYTPFIYVEDDIDINGERSDSSKTRRKQLLPNAAGDPVKRANKEPIDPYTLILDGDLDPLRPNLKDAMDLEDHYNYLGTAPSFNLRDLQKTFFRTGILQIVSARSRPDAFMSEKTATNPQDAQAGIVDIKVTKVGLLWRKDTKKRKTRSPWQEWGAILTGAQLYFFRNTSWIKNLMHQHEHHLKSGNDGIPVIFQPPMEEFKPDGLMTTQGAVALLDTTYKKHKNAFVYVRPGGVSEVLLADDEEELNDWLAKLNYAAAFRTTGVRMRGVVGGNYDGQGRRAIRRLDSSRQDSSEVTQLVQTPSGPVSIARGRIDHKMAEDIQSARRDFMRCKIEEGDKKLEELQKQLEQQLRNARHLQILAPIQPRSRDQLLAAAARRAAHLQWTRMEIWKERCHRDILVQDLEEDLPPPGFAATPSKQPSEHERPSSPTPRPVARTRRLSSAEAEKNPPKELRLSLVPKTSDVGLGVESPSSQEFQTPPQSATQFRHASIDASDIKPDGVDVRHGSVSSTPASPGPSPATPQAGCVTSRDGDGTGSTDTTNHDDHHDEVDAEERDLLKQTGLLQERMGRDPTEKPTSSNSAEVLEQLTPADRERSDRNKIRRSLHRTLREGAGHLSHHRSRKGKEGSFSGPPDDVTQDASVILSRGTGSFVVHGKKASVINLGTEIKTMSHDDKLRARKQSYQPDQPLSPISTGEDDDFHSAVVDLTEAPESVESITERRESNASASTATARSFRELHRKYSTAQAARSVSAGGRLTIPSDGESEAAVSFSDGRWSPLPPIETESEDEDHQEDDQFRLGRSRLPRAERRSNFDGAHEQSVGDETDESLDEEDVRREPEHLANRPLQAVNA